LSEKVKYDLVIGSLLHNIGKILFDDYKSSYENLKIYEELNINNQDILDCIRYQTYEQIQKSNLDSDSIALISYIANAIVSDINYIKNEEFKDEDFDKNTPLYSVFNVLNDNNDSKFYKKVILSQDCGINNPTKDEDDNGDDFFRKIRENIRNIISKIRLNTNYINNLLLVLEDNLSYIPASTSKEHLKDISFYDNIRITGAVATCIYQYLLEKNETDFKTFLFDEKSRDEDMFLLYSLGLSRIQNFIYNISSKGALKALRARSFYLEIMMEHIVDSFLEELNLTRVNLIYLGGGQCYMMLPNTEKVKSKIENLQKDLKTWFIDKFDISLYISGESKECSANKLQDILIDIEVKKFNRYSADDIKELNKHNVKEEGGKRECSMCRKIDELKDDNDDEHLCTTCYALKHIANSILSNKYFMVLTKEQYKNLGVENSSIGEAIRLPFDSLLISLEYDEYFKFKNNDIKARFYAKNDFSSDGIASRIFIGDYRAKRDNKYLKNPTLEELAEKSEGIEKICVLRADVDNLGSAFISGFKSSKLKSNLARRATLSRQLSLFFKYYINDILSNGKNDILSKNKDRNIVVVYSGGDDMFLIGAWNDVIQSGLDLKKAFDKFTQNTLSISAGIGLYDSKYPINIMAKETGILEEYSKKYEKDGKNKNAVTLFDESNCYSWKEFEESVLKEKFKFIQDFFENTDERGNSFLFNILEFLKNIKEKINIARFIFLLSRLEPEKNSENYDEKITIYRKFAETMYQWIKKDDDIRQVITAIYLYVYLNRKKQSEKDGGKNNGKE
jgi:CRISPR-associated protein, csm1 family